MPTTDVDLKYALGLKPEKAIEYFKAKGYAISFDWHEVWKEANARAFTVAKVMKMDILQDIRDGLQDALDNGTAFQTFQKTLEPTLKAKGWWGRQEIVDERTGEIREAQLGSPYRLRTIFDQNIQTAYNAGRYRTQMENVSAAPYLQYVAVMDARTRPAHAALNGLVFRATDPFWDSFYPPNGWRCRCRVRQLDDGMLTERELALDSSSGKLSRRQETVGGELKSVAVFKGRDAVGNKVAVSPDVGWDYNPGKTDWKPDLQKYSPDIRALGKDL